MRRISEAALLRINVLFLKNMGFEWFSQFCSSSVGLASHCTFHCAPRLDFSFPPNFVVF